MNKIIIAVIVAVIALGGYFILKGSRSSLEKAPTTTPISNETSTAPSSKPNVIITQPPASQPSSSSQQAAVEKPAVDKKEHIITYTDNGYAPAALTIKKGETVIFKNQSSREMWTASAMHPTHRVYPTTGGCLGSTFDACKGVQAGDSWSFKFDVSGNWKYHDHLTPGDRGEIIVQVQ